jgi:hypothetical protein
VLRVGISEPQTNSFRCRAARRRDQALLPEGRVTRFTPDIQVEMHGRSFCIGRGFCIGRIIDPECLSLLRRARL